ncbi:DUF1573 domain-containing protein [Puia sp.]|jgi:hypothetical protein|uniref:DUF1573 domain-containing protein n=1 Tax=Puia sp. TaxID=2045100 RepID=UPI002F4057C1
MKKLGIVITLFVTSLAVSAQAVNTGGTALPRPADMLLVKENSHNFGKIPQGRPATTTFEVVNTGTVAMKLDNVQASCGCTTPVWSHDPIEAGGTAKIVVGYNAYAEGPFTKTVTVVYNTNMTKTLTISGEVYKTPATSAPDNASVQLLKQIN